jgi:1-acyl-sn-glycerol-3-phosphate acyltransferase
MYRLLIIIAHILILITCRFTVKGINSVPVRGPFLLVSNHLSVADPVILGAKIGRQVTFMAKEELFRQKLIGYFIRSFSAFPVYRGKSNRDALHQAAEILQKGKVLGMFPEGKRSQEQTLNPGLLGAAMIAYHNKVNILPVSIYGSEQVKGLKWIFRRPKVVLTIGEPFLLHDTGHSLKKEQLNEMTKLIMNKIAVLLPEEYRGSYSNTKYENS